MSYRLRLTESELRTLAWVADRYTCAEVLFDGLEQDEEDAEVFSISETVAWRYSEELEEENGCGMLVPPCVGGTLADKLIRLRNAIV